MIVEILQLTGLKTILWVKEQEDFRFYCKFLALAMAEFYLESYSYICTMCADLHAAHQRPEKLLKFCYFLITCIVTDL